MRINGAKISGSNTKIVVFPRQAGDIVFKVAAVVNYDDFDKLFPFPAPATVVRPGGEKSQDIEDPEYKKAISTWSAARSAWMSIQSILGTAGLQLETVVKGDPTTWANWIQEFLDSGFTVIEINRLIEAVMEVNGLNEKSIEAATQRFLASQAATQPEE